MFVLPHPLARGLVRAFVDYCWREQARLDEAVVRDRDELDLAGGDGLGREEGEEEVLDKGRVWGEVWDGEVGCLRGGWRVALGMRRGQNVLQSRGRPYG